MPRRHVAAKLPGSKLCSTPWTVALLTRREVSFSDCWVATTSLRMGVMANVPAKGAHRAGQVVLDGVEA